MSIANLSPIQIIAIWDDLTRAYYGKNGYGGSVAQIYLHTCMAHSPAAARFPGLTEGFFYEAAIADYAVANQALYDVITMFQARWHAVVRPVGQHDLSCLLSEAAPETWRIDLEVIPVDKHT